MASIGMYGVFYAKCVLLDGVTTGYTGGAKMMGRAISAGFEPNTPDDNPLYANNGIAESDSSGASGGTLSITLDRLTMEAAADMFGLQIAEATVLVNGKQAVGRGLRYTGREQSAPLGVAFIRMNQVNGVRNYEVVRYRRTTFSMPSENAQTMGGSIEWKTPELTAAVMGMEDNGDQAWYETMVFSTQAAAIAYIESVFGIMAEKTNPIAGQGAAGYAKVGDVA